MTNTALNSILGLTEKLKVRRVYRRTDDGDAKEFGIRDVDRLIRYFDAELAAESVTYPAFLWLEGRYMDGTFTVHRDGRLVVQLDH